jgi:N-acyl homoserine lactone hydrolase
MATANKVSVIPCGAMTADLTWLLLKPGRSITDRHHKEGPAPWVDVPTHRGTPWAACPCRSTCPTPGR